MSKSRWLVLTIVWWLLNFNSNKVFAQSKDTGLIATDTIRATAPVKKDHRPRNAALRSAIIPGWGQAYNKKYWKIPIIYVLGGTIAYFYVTNVQVYRENRDLLKTAVANGSVDPNTNIYRINRDRFREYRDWNIAMFVGLYILNIIDANVDAHLREFDVGEDLSFTVKPYLYADLYNSPVSGITVNLKFKK